jgi:hypothetical protein
VGTRCDPNARDGDRSEADGDRSVAAEAEERAGFARLLDDDLTRIAHESDDLAARLREWSGRAEDRAVCRAVGTVGAGRVR